MNSVVIRIFHPDTIKVLHGFLIIQQSLKCWFLILLHFVAVLISKDLKKVSVCQIIHVMFICKPSYVNVY